MEILPAALRMFLLGAVFVCVGCDPAYKLTGQVTSSTTGAPIAGATVKAVCPNPPTPSATSDAAGKVNSRDLGFFADDCRIEVRAKDYVTQTFTVAAVCRRRHLGSCLEIDVDAKLVPVAP
ncbi:MAG TPA: carboxypeptidase-like regulatory domain-containing protein [Polyangium sp.]|nr:carboxypeptidase-like regulatory domain-containing protein [Polyangium sp.]